VNGHVTLAGLVLLALVALFGDLDAGPGVALELADVLAALADDATDLDDENNIYVQNSLVSRHRA
jgi:hypothetical protein